MIFNSGKLKSGFTLIELMVVLFIIGILSAVAISYMRGRVDASKWSEGKAAAGSIRTAARAFCAEKGPAYPYTTAPPSLTDLGFALRASGRSDLDGKYFSEEAYQITFSGYDDYEITVTPANSVGRPDGPQTPAVVKFDETGAFTEN